MKTQKKLYVTSYLYLARMPMRPRAENWSELCGIGCFPKFNSKGLWFSWSDPSLECNLSRLGPSFKVLSGILFWKAAFRGGGGNVASSDGVSAPSSTHLFSFSS